MIQRKIIHIDMDAFYASVELRDRPELRGLPMIVASDRPRSVVTTATYEARQFGLRSAMSVAKAKQLCPQVICIPPDFNKYRTVSSQLQQIFQRYTALIEPISLDEAFLDVTENLTGLASATEVAQHIRADIVKETGLTASAGVAPNKFLAKIASDWNKPDGLCVIKPSQVQGFIQTLPLEKIPGVGKVTLQKLIAFNWQTIGDIQSIEEQVLVHHFGKFGRRLYLYAQGIDDRPVQSERERQQISKEITFEQDYFLTELDHVWQPLIDKVWQQLQRKKMIARGVQVKLKTTDFKTLQHSRTFSHAFENAEQLLHAVKQLLQEFEQHKDLKFRLAGMGVFNLEDQMENVQLSFL
ncbi:DNA polymerase IV [Acinetobacter puyangensis]|uniref:DNA polymerase IV n=1 Tax=Acinetobacter puyangensis TaxID=1096779 RepID=UPI003A4E2B9D